MPKYEVKVELIAEYGTFSSSLTEWYKEGWRLVHFIYRAFPDKGGLFVVVMERPTDA